MFSTCVYCHGALGANEVVEQFPVGRKLAFDGARGRLWVVCRHCARWNLSPLEERWEAIEDCERLYRATPLKASTDQIGLAKLNEGLELVRVGAPTRPEFAAWRYGDLFRRRQIGAWALMGATSAIMLGGIGLKFVNPTLHSAIPLAGSIPTVVHWWMMYQLTFRVVTRVEHRGQSVTLRRTDLANMRLEFANESRDHWQLNVLHKMGRSILTDTEAHRVLGKALVAANQEGGSRETVNTAVQRLAEAGSADAFVRQYINTGKGVFSGSWREGTRDQQLALEMALHEDTERAALEGDLAALERAWEEAEEIAAIADNLLMPEWVQQRIRPGGRPRD